MADVILDLFGLPVRQPREGKGRPEHEWTEQNSHKISILLAIGKDVKDIATIMQLSQPTLRKHYFSELSARKTAHDMLVAHQLYRLNREAEAGNVAAEKALFALVERERTRLASDRLAGPAPKPTRAAPPKLGKKAQADADALGIGGKYAPPIDGLRLN